MTCFTNFKEPIDQYQLPMEFTFPFNYTPHPLCVLAASELQDYIASKNEWAGIFNNETGRGESAGKMFGVLVVQNINGDIGYLSAFSGRFAGNTKQSIFVPPIFDTDAPNNFFRKGEAGLNSINSKIKRLKESYQYNKAKKQLEETIKESLRELNSLKEEMKLAKSKRDEQRKWSENNLAGNKLTAFLKKLENESRKYKYDFRQLSQYWDKQISNHKAVVNSLEEEIELLKEKRKKTSAELQQQLFDQYQFLNINGEEKSVCDIFIEIGQKVPPAAAGECAAPKLLQYAFKHKMKPLAMAEFWWGQSPKSVIRKHKLFYPACRSKCEPILSHMLKGMKIEKNPLNSITPAKSELDIIFEDDAIIIVNKPAGLLSTPGKQTYDSVFSRIKEAYPKTNGPLIVHRLDMATSGLMVIAKTKETHENIQKQFLDKSVKKRYVALLEGIIRGEKGFIDLPLRVDLDNRPQQMVCLEHGKHSQTVWRVIERRESQTLIHFFPLTGRTHQLRVHSAHPKGLNTPIVGDELYGEKKDRLHLHAEGIEFKHPITNKIIRFNLKAEF